MVNGSLLEVLKSIWI